MGKAPDVIFVVRHGARLDAADKNWQSSSPTPWDTPLSYGGWQQTRALGARIAGLLRARNISINDEDASGKRRSSDTSYLGGGERPGSSHSTHSSQSGHSAPSYKKKRHRVILHTSPFLRCIQSSIAISAGMAQYQGNLAKFEAAGSTTSTKSSKSHPTPHNRSQTLDSKTFMERYGSNITPETFEKAKMQELPDVIKNKLRIDAFLGEWLSTDYFDYSAAPPASNMMIAGAKADLLKSGQSIQGAKIIPFEDSSSYFPLAPTHLEEKPRPQEPLQSMNDLVRSLPGYGAPPKSMASVYGSASNLPSHHPAVSPGPKTPGSVKGYIPPQPLYALAPVEPIPQGFVAHARDACVDIDFSWDSNGEPQNWGDGGSYGEEWSALHNRFRKGIRDLVQWYKVRGPEFDPQDLSIPSPSPDTPHDGDDDEDTELIVVLVTHGAGCNALIGALTNQPVLMDVGMASLTMATYKGAPPSGPPSSHPSTDHLSLASHRPHTSSPPLRTRRRSSIDMSLSHEYDMKLVANSEHLRAGADPLAIPQLTLSSSMPDRDRSRRFSNASSLGLGSPLASGPISPFEIEGTSRPPARNSALGSIRRNGTAGSSRSFMSDAGIKPMGNAASTGSQGLWGTSSRAQSAIETDELEESLSPTTIHPPDKRDGGHVTFDEGQIASQSLETGRSLTTGIGIDGASSSSSAPDRSSGADAAGGGVTPSSLSSSPSGPVDVPSSSSRPIGNRKTSGGSVGATASSATRSNTGMWGSSKASASRSGSGLWSASPRGVSALRRSDTGN